MIRSVFDAYHQLWPATRHEVLRPLLKHIQCLHYPSELHLFSQANKKQSIVVVKNKSAVNFTEIFAMGFEHLVFREREDFAQELLASTLMVLRPETFARNPLPFFFTGFQAPDLNADSGQSLVLDFYDSRDKEKIKDSLSTFFSAIPAVRFASDLVLQVADEMITNAMFNAPLMSDGRRPFAAAERDRWVVLPADKKVRMFTCYTESRIIIGCEDSYGSLDRESVLQRWIKIYDDKAQVDPGETGSGLGMKLMIDNAANFYLYSEKQKKTLIACAFLLGGRKANMTESKHMHFSVR